MYPLETIKAINNRPHVRRDNFNRDSSAIASRGGFVIHSGIHRETAFISPDDHPDSFHSLNYWRHAGQKAVNAWIVAIIDGADVESAERAAFIAARPGWKLRANEGAGKLKGAAGYTATRKRGGFETRVSAFRLVHLHHKTRKP